MTDLYYIEDDPDIACTVKEYLEQKGFAVTICATLAQAKHALKMHVPALVLLDWNMPDGRGDSMCRWIRGGWKELPIMFLTVRGDSSDIVFGFENGADDYVVKPFGIMELQARVKAVLRRTERRGDRVLTWGDVELDPAAREVHKAGKPVELTYKEFELLKLLFSRRGVALTRDEILQAVWDYDYTGETRTVDMHVKALRQKLGEDIITTVRGVGYKMV